MEKRRHHYIPVFYLNYFTDLQTPSVQTPYVWILDRKNETVDNKAPRNFAFIKGYNDIIDSEGNVSNIVEDQFNFEIELKASTVFRKLMSIKYLSKSDRFILAKFVAAKIFRVPKFRKAFKEIVEEKYYREFPNGGSDFEGVSSQLMMDSVVRTSGIIGNLLMRMDWSLLIAPDGSHFITSDNPVVVRNPDDPKWLFCGFASDTKIQVTFPLSAKICLFGAWGRYKRIIEYITEEEVIEINFETFKYSFEFLYSSTRYFRKEILLVNHLVNKGHIK